MIDRSDLMNRVKEAVMKYDLVEDADITNSCSDIIRRRVVGYAVVQFNYSIVQPDDSSKYVQLKPLFENVFDDSDIEYDINLPECANVINVLPVTTRTVGVFGGIPSNDTTLDDLKNDSVCCSHYKLLGIETDGVQYDRNEWKSKLIGVWNNVIFSNLLTNADIDE